MCVNQEKRREVDLSDLERDWVVKWQDKYYLFLAVLTAFVLPTVVASAWGDALVSI